MISLTSKGIVAHSHFPQLADVLGKCAVKPLADLGTRAKPTSEKSPFTEPSYFHNSEISLALKLA